MPNFQFQSSSNLHIKPFPLSKKNLFEVSSKLTFVNQISIPLFMTNNYIIDKQNKSNSRNDLFPKRVVIIDNGLYKQIKINHLEMNKPCLHNECQKTNSKSNKLNINENEHLKKNQSSSKTNSPLILINKEKNKEDISRFGLNSNNIKIQFNNEVFIENNFNNNRIPQIIQKSDYFIVGDTIYNPDQEIGIEGTLPSKSFHDKKVIQNYLDSFNKKSLLMVKKNEIKRRRSKSEQYPIIINSSPSSTFFQYLPGDWKKPNKFKLCNIDHLNNIKYIDSASMNVYCEKCSLSIIGKNNLITLKNYIQNFSEEVSNIIKMANQEIERIAFSTFTKDSRNEIISSLENEFDKYIELIRKCKNDVVQIINKILSDINETNSEIASSIADLLEEKIKKLRSSFSSKNPLQILSKINTRLNEYLKKAMKEIKEKNDILTLSTQQILNMIQIPDLSSSNILAKLGFQISSCSIIKDSKFTWINGSKIFKKDLLIGTQTYSTSTPFLNDDKIVIKFLKINDRKEIYFGLSKFKINSQYIIDPVIEYSLDTINIISLNNNNHRGHNIDYFDLKEGDTLTINIHLGNIEIYINSILKLTQFSNIIEFPFFYFVSLVNFADEIEIID